MPQRTASLNFKVSIIGHYAALFEVGYSVSPRISMLIMQLMQQQLLVPSNYGYVFWIKRPMLLEALGNSYYQQYHGLGFSNS